MQWVAQGFIQPNDKDKLVDIGEDYFMELLSKSVFQDVTKNKFGDIITCKMHDLMHDLACLIGENECDHDVNAHVLNKRTHHISFASISWEELEKLPETLSDVRNLRTCFLLYDRFLVGRDNNLNKIFESVICNLLRLRTLKLILSTGNQIAKFLTCISKLKHLRYLEIEMSKHTEFFPKSITGLYNLEVLILICKGLKELPRDLKNWNKLKYLYLYENENIEFLPNSIVELNNLEILVLQNCTKLKEFPRDIKNLTNLAHLDLRGNKNIECLPNSISDLIHLQHLNLSSNRNIEFLPNSISELCELKTLILQGCIKLKELPRDVNNWINLRLLDLSWGRIQFLPDSITQLKKLEKILLCFSEIKEFPGDTKNLINLEQLDMDGCRALTHMPKGLGELTNLQTLNLFVLSKDNNGGGLSELNGLNKLKVSLAIKGLQFCTTSDLQTNAKFLQLKSGLQELVLEWEWNDDSFNEPTIDSLDNDYERVLECLHPHSNLQVICIKGYGGVKLCNWLSSSSYSFDCLVCMELSSCERLQHLPQFHQFPNLKFLRLQDLPNIVHIDNHDCPSSSTLFPSLEELKISGMPNLKRWWKKGQTSTKLSAQNSILFPIIFPYLSRLHSSEDCPLLTSATCDAPSKSLEINNSIEYHIDRMMN